MKYIDEVYMIIIYTTMIWFCLVYIWDILPPGKAAWILGANCIGWLMGTLINWGFRKCPSATSWRP